MALGHLDLASLVTLAAITSPADGATLAPNQTFTWSAGFGVTQYWFVLTTHPGCAAPYLCSTGPITSTSTTLSVPLNVGTVFGCLWSFVSGWQTPDMRTYTAPTAAASAAAIQTPAPGSTLTTQTPTFTWNAAPGAVRYWVYIGPTAGSNTYYESGPIDGAVLSHTVDMATQHLPKTGTIVVTLWTFLPAPTGWISTNATYTMNVP